MKKIPFFAFTDCLNQMTRRKKGLESLGKIYENIGRTRDRIRPGRDDDRGDRGGRDQDGGASAAAQSDAAAGMGGY